MSLHNKTFLSKSRGWFRLPENIQRIFNGIGLLGNITTADATNEATAITLANANKAKINQILEALREVEFTN